MKAAVLEAFHEPLVVREVPDPEPASDGAVVRVEANGVCRSDWHAWVGDWPESFRLPHVLGHELAGVVEAVGPGVRAFRTGDRVVVPFCTGDGVCQWCRAGHPHLCDDGVALGFGAWGGFAEYVAVPHADVNLVRLPEAVDFVAGASMGCRYITAFHALANQAALGPGEWVAVFGAGGVGLSAVQIASALGANAVAVDVNARNLELARSLGAVAVIDAGRDNHPARAVRELTEGGAHVSVDALGAAVTCRNAVRSLRKRGRHVQVGLTTRAEGGEVALPIDLVVEKELVFVGSHGMPPTHYGRLLAMVESGKLAPAKLVTRTIALEAVSDVLAEMDRFQTVGITVVDRF